MPLYIRLFYEFFKTGLFAIGGGMATVPFLKDISARTGWFTSGELADMIAVSESTPGPMGVNMATYVGFTVGKKYYGIPGAIGGSLISTFALVLPSIIVVLLVSAFLERFKENRIVMSGLYGLRAASAGLIASAGISVVFFSIFRIDSIYELKKAAVDIRFLILAALIFIFTRYIPRVKDLHPLCFIVFAGLFGIIFHMSV